MSTSSPCGVSTHTGAVANDQLNFFTSSGRGNVISLRSTGTPLVAYNGANLSDGGDWNNASSVVLKTDFQELDTRAVLGASIRFAPAAVEIQSGVGGDSTLWANG